MTDKTRPSLLYIHSDQHNPYVTGCYGDPLIQTPVLDRLAETGVLFENTYCCSPICVPSRMSTELNSPHGGAVQGIPRGESSNLRRIA